MKEEDNVPQNHTTKEPDPVLQVGEYLPEWVTVKLRSILYMEMRMSH